MKNKDSPNIVLSKYEKGDTPTEIFRDLNGGIGSSTIKRWCSMIRRFGSLQLPGTRGGPRIVRTLENIQKVKISLRWGKRVSARKLSMKLGISRMSFVPVSKYDLGLSPTKKSNRTTLLR